MPRQIFNFQLSRLPLWGLKPDPISQSVWAAYCLLCGYRFLISQRSLFLKQTLSVGEWGVGVGKISSASGENGKRELKT